MMRGSNERIGPNADPRRAPDGARGFQDVGHIG